MDDTPLPRRQPDMEERQRLVEMAIQAARAQGVAVPQEVASLPYDAMLDLAERNALAKAVAEARASGPGVPHAEVEAIMQARLESLMVRVEKLAAKA